MCVCEEIIYHPSVIAEKVVVCICLRNKVKEFCKT